MKQTIEERKQHHQTREDRQRNALEVLRWRISAVRREYMPGRFVVFNVEAAKREAANLARKLKIEN